MQSDDQTSLEKTLKELGPNIRDSDGRTALINAVIEAKVQTIDLLLDMGVDVNIQDRAGYLALHFVAQKNLLEIGKRLLSHGASVELRDVHGNTALWTAVMNSRQGLRILKIAT